MPRQGDSNFRVRSAFILARMVAPCFKPLAPGDGNRDDSRQFEDPDAECFLSLCRSELRFAEAIDRPLVADVDIFRRIQSAAVVSMPVGRGHRCPRRHTARVRGALCAEAAVAVHGECSGKRTQAVGWLNNVDQLRLTFLIFRASYLHRDLDSGA